MSRKHLNPNKACHTIWRTKHGEWPMEDLAPEGIIWMPPPNEADKACAVQGDANACVYAQTWVRINNVPTAQIGIDKCYLPIVRNGEVVVIRCKTDAETRRLLQRFDETGEAPEEGLFFYGIPPSEQIGSKRAQNKRYRTRWSEKGAAGQAKRKIHIRSAASPASVIRAK